MRGKIFTLFIFLTYIVLVAFAEENETKIIPLKPENYPALIEAYKGKIIVVNIWSTFCDPCREEFPEFLEIYQTFQEKPFKLLFISVDFPDDLDRVKNFLEHHKVTFPTYWMDGKDEPFIKAVNPEWSGAIPATLIYSPEGRRVFFKEGKITKDEILNILLPIVQKESNQGG